MVSPENEDEKNKMNGKSSAKVGIAGEKSTPKSEGPTLVDKLYVKLHWKGLPVVAATLIAISDIYISYSQGISTAISALAAEGTMTLALVTYLQMKTGQQKTRP